MLTRFAAGLLAGLLPLLAQADVFKWVDAEGRTHYSNVPPKDVKTRRVDSGGVTVVPALTPPPVPAASASAPPPAAVPMSMRPAVAPEPLPASSVPSAPPPASAAATGKSAYDAAAPAPAPAPAPVPVPQAAPEIEEFKPLPGWSQPPIRPRGNRNAIPAGDASAPAS